MQIRKKILQTLPDAYYSNGEKSQCLVYTLCDLFDPLSKNPNKEVKEKKNMEEFNLTESAEVNGFITCENLVADLGKEFVLNGQRVTVEDGKVVVKK